MAILLYIGYNVILSKTKMEDKVFISPRLTGSRFTDHALPVKILEDFNALEGLLIELAKDQYLAENPQRKRVPKGFSDGVYLELLSIGTGSVTVPISVANMPPVTPELSMSDQGKFHYFEESKEKLISIIESVNNSGMVEDIDVKYLRYFKKMGKNLMGDETIDFGYNQRTNTESGALLNKTSRRKLLLSVTQNSEYMDSVRLFALVPGIDQNARTFMIEEDFGKITCPLKDEIRENVLTAVSEYENNTYVTLNGTALFNRADKIIKIEDVESIDILDPMDVSLRIYQLRKLESNWYEGWGKAINQEGLTKFEHLFNLFYNEKLPLPAIYPKTDGNIQLEW